VRFCREEFDPDSRNLQTDLQTDYAKVAGTRPYLAGAR
jgi:hypothetical protein